MVQVNKTPYPMLSVDTQKLTHNVEIAVKNCEKAGIQVAGVIKGFNGIPEAARAFIDGGCSQLATSRMDQIIELKEMGVEAEFLLVRIPMISEAEEVAYYADLSLQSEIKVLEAVNKACEKFGKKHGIILMADLGDLREGFWDKDEMVKAAAYVEEKLTNIELKGVGTNLGCYGSIKPTVDKMEDLIEVAEKIEAKIGRKLEIISGGATSSYPIVLDGLMPERINHLRIGEGIILAYDLKEIWGLNMDDMYQDVFSLKAEVIEIKDKPTHPVGEIFIDCFGMQPTYEDRGVRKRALLATGKLDYTLSDKIFPRIEGVEVIGDSSDHCILDIEECSEDLQVGDVVEFDLSYPSLMYLSNSRYINKFIK